MATPYENVVNCISKPAEDRSDKEVNDLIGWFCKKSEKIFRPLKQDVVADIIRNCQFSIVRRDDVIVRQGELGDSFYIILRGKVSVLIGTVEAASSDGNGNIKNHNEKNNKLQPADAGDKGPFLAPLRYDEHGKLDRSQLGRAVATIGEGNAFGELALLSVDCVRNASVVADSDAVDLAVVSRELYARSLRAAQAAEFDARLSFVDGHPLTSRWPIKYRRQLAMSLREEIGLQFEQQVVKQGDAADTIYFIAKGQCKVVINPGLHRIHYRELVEQTELTERSAKVVVVENDALIDTTLPDLNDVVSHLHRRRRGPKTPQHRSLDLCLIGPFETIGDIEFAFGLPVYVQTVVCSQPSTLYTLSHVNYERLFVNNKHNKNAVQRMRDLVGVKLEARLSRHDVTTVPLFKSLYDRLQVVNGTKYNNSNRNNHLQHVVESETRLQQQRERRTRSNSLDGTSPPWAGNYFIREDGASHMSRRQVKPTAKSIDSLATSREKQKKSNENRKEVIDEDSHDDNSDFQLTQLEDRIRTWKTDRRFDVTMATRITANTSPTFRLHRSQTKARKLVPGSRVYLKYRAGTSNDRRNDIESEATFKNGGGGAAAGADETTPILLKLRQLKQQEMSKREQSAECDFIEHALSGKLVLNFRPAVKTQNSKFSKTEKPAVDHQLNEEIALANQFSSDGLSISHDPHAADQLRNSYGQPYDSSNAYLREPASVGGVVATAAATKNVSWQGDTYRIGLEA